jgi:hypothetical protein
MPLPPKKPSRLVDFLLPNISGEKLKLPLLLKSNLDLKLKRKPLLEDQRKKIDYPLNKKIEARNIFGLSRSPSFLG